MPALLPLEVFLAIELIDEPDAGHAELFPLPAVHGAKGLVEGLRAEEEAGVGHAVPLDLAFQHSTSIELHEPVDQHLGRGIQPLVKSSNPTHTFDDVTEAGENAGV